MGAVAENSMVRVLPNWCPVFVHAWPCPEGLAWWFLWSQQERLRPSLLENVRRFNGEEKAVRIVRWRAMAVANEVARRAAVTVV